MLFRSFPSSLWSGGAPPLRSQSFVGTESLHGSSEKPVCCFSDLWSKSPLVKYQPKISPSPSSRPVVRGFSMADGEPCLDYGSLWARVLRHSISGPFHPQKSSFYGCFVRIPVTVNEPGPEWISLMSSSCSLKI